VLKKILFLFAVTLLISCDEDDECIKARGNEILSVREVQSFQTLRVSLSALVSLEINDELTAPEVRIIAQTNIHERIATNVSEGVLDISYSECIEELKEVDIIIRTPSLNRIDIEGPAIIRSSKLIEQDRLYVYGNASGDCDLLVSVDSLVVESYGSGELNFDGYAKKGAVLLATSADFYGFQLATDTLLVEVASSGIAQVRANELLRVSMKGSGNVLYKGSPTVTVTGSGDGEVLDVN